MTLFQAAASDHTSLAKHFTAEKCVESFEPGKGRSVKWVTKSRSNHWFDAGYYGCCAGHFCGWSLTDEPLAGVALQQQASAEPYPYLFTTPSGAPFVATER